MKTIGDERLAGPPPGRAGPAGAWDERGRLLAALAESEARYRAVVAPLEEGVTLHDAAGRILAANASAARILGVPAGELAGLSLTDPAWASVDTRSEPLSPDQHPVSVALATGEPPYPVLVGLVDRGGEFHWLRVVATPTAPGPEARVICLFADITAPRREEEDRQRIEVNFRTLIERNPDAVAVYQNDTICYVNPRMVSLFGYERADEMLGRPASAIFDPRRRVVPAWDEARPATEERFYRRDGEPVPAEVTVIPIFFDGEPATLVHARDLTIRKSLEAQVVMADRLASVGRIAAAVGHEMNNPLAYVMANIDLTLERLSDPTESAADQIPDIVEMLREARDGADRVRRIVRDLKVFSQSDTEERAAVDPRRVLDSCVNMARAEIRHRARLVKRYAETPPVIANEARLGQVLLNLLVNATQAIPTGDVTANEIQVGTWSDERGRVVIEVKDSGEGIPEEVQRHIFEPFFTTKTGTGMGLSICRSIVASLGGEIELESHVGRGTAFRVILPPAPDASSRGPI